MVCGSCVDKLAFRLMRNHPRQFDMILAYEAALKGMERYEQHNHPEPKDVELRSLTIEEKAELAEQGIDPDYNAACVAGGTCSCYGRTKDCASNADCFNGSLCTVAAGACDKPNSHYVSDNCYSYTYGTCSCGALICNIGKTCTCGAGGVVYCACNDGYVWNPTTLQCEPAPAKKFIGDGLVGFE